MPTARMGLKAAREAGRLTITKTLTPRQIKRINELCFNLPLLQREIFDLGLTQTAAQMGRALEVIGWEVAEIWKRIDRVTPAERRYRRLAAKRERDTLPRRRRT